jgi:hypothetical protein
MNRSFPSTAREALRFLVGALLCGSACVPDQGVKAGAPELIQFTIVQGGTTATTVKPDTPDCDTAIKTSDACDPRMDGLCRLASANNWCTCVADSTDMTMGAWNCDPFANVTAVIAVFDRLLDTAPFEPGDAPIAGAMTTSATGGLPAVDIGADYSATGDQNGLIFNFFGPLFFGNFRADGPSLFGVPDPEFPNASTIMVSLQADKVHAKDGKTPYKGTGQLQGGTLIFTMAPFAAALLAPDAMAMDPISVTVAFTNMAPNPKAHVTAKANGAPIAVDVTGDDGSSTFAVTPMGGGAWPAGAMIEITMDATAQNLLGQMLAAAPDPLSFTAP